MIGIRAAEIPTPTKHNGKEIARLTRLKTIYALKGTGKDFESGLAGLFEMLEARAKA